MELYLLKSTLALSLLYAIYWLLLRNETYFRLNRIYLISSLLISLLIPLLKLNFLNGIQQSFSHLASPIVISSSSRLNTIAETKGSIGILSIIYISGAVFFSLRFLSRLSHIYFLYYRFPKTKFNGFRTVIINGNQSPFTFFSILFLSSSDYKEGKLSEMIVHEKAHRDQLHTIDLMLLECTTILQWFNPFLWLFRIALKAEHEFLADEKVLKAGFDKVTYQQLLFEKSLGVTALGVTSNFNYSLLKNRLKMMTTKKSGSFAKIKYLLSMPLLLGTVLTLTISFNSYGQEDKVYTEVDVQPKYKGGDMDNVRSFIAENIKYPEEAYKNNVTATIYVQFIIDENGNVNNVEIVRPNAKQKTNYELVVTAYKSKEAANVDQKNISSLEAESIRIVKMLSGFTPAQKDGKNVKMKFVFPIVFALQ